MARAITLEFLEVTLKREDVNRILIQAATSEANHPAVVVDPSGLADIRTDNYGGYIVILQKKKD